MFVENISCRGLEKARSSTALGAERGRGEKFFREIDFFCMCVPIVNKNITKRVDRRGAYIMNWTRPLLIDSIFWILKLTTTLPSFLLLCTFKNIWIIDYLTCLGAIEWPSKLVRLHSTYVRSTDLSSPMWNFYAYKESKLGWTGSNFTIFADFFSLLSIIRFLSSFFELCNC